MSRRSVPSPTVVNTLPNSTRERIRQSMRADVLTALIQQGLDSRQAAEWVALWEVETSRQGITHSADYFWDAAKGWIDAHRNSRTPL